MADKKFSVKLAVEQEAAFKKALQSIGGEFKILNAEAKKLQATYAEDANSYTALSGKLKILGEQYDALTKKLETQQDALENQQKLLKQYESNTDSLAKNVEKTKDAYDGATEKTDDLKKAMEKASAAYKQNERSIEACKSRIQTYERQIVETETQQIELNSAISKTKGYLQEAATSADGTAQSIDRYGKEVKQAADDTRSFGEAANVLAQAIAASGAIEGAEKLRDAIIDTAKASIEYESAFAGVRKTVDGTAEELAEISDGIKKMATEIPQSTTEIAKIAETAGQLGIAKDSILDFTEVMAALGVTTNLSSEEAATSLARFANITKMSETQYSNLGSSIVALGNNFATTEAEIVEMATRLASTGEVVGLTEPQILAAATALSSLGIEAEAGGTAFSKLLKTIETAVESGSDDVKKYADIAGQSVEEFSAAWREDAVSALSEFINGLGRLESEGTSTVSVLNELGLTEVRLSNAVLALASSEGILSDALDVSNAAWEENTALAEEAAIRYGTTESKLQILNNSFNNLKITIGDELLNSFGGAIDGLTDLTNAADEYVKKNPEVVAGLTAVAAGIGSFAVIGTALPLIASLTTALLAIPHGAVAAGIAALVVAVGTFIATLPEADTEVNRLNGRLETLREQLDATHDSTIRLKEANEQQTNAISTEAQEIEKAIATVEELGKKTDLTASESALLKSAMDKLNGSIPGLKLSYDNLNDSLEDTVYHLRLVASAQALVNEAVAKSELRESLTSHSEQLQNDLDNADKLLKEAQTALEAKELLEEEFFKERSSDKQTEEALKPGESPWSPYSEEIKELELALQEANNLYITAAGAREANKRKIYEIDAEIAKLDSQYAEKAAEIKSTTTDLFGSVGTGVEEAADAFDEFMSSVEETGKKSAAVLADYGDAFEAGFSVPFLTAINETASNSDEVLGAMMARYNELVTTYGKGSAEVKSFVNEVNTAFAESAGSETALVDGLKEFGIVVEETGKKAVTSTKATKEAIDEAGQAIITHADTVKKNLETLTKEYDSAYKSARTSLDGMGGAFESLVFTSDKSVGEMQSNLRTQADYFTGTLNNINNAVRVGFNKDLVSSLAEGGKQTQGYLQTIMDEFTKLAIKYGENSEEAQSFVDSFNEDFERTSLAKDALAQTMAGMQTNFEERKGDILAQASDLVTELEGYNGNAYDEVSQAVADVVGNVSATLGKIETAIAESSVNAGTAMQTMRDTLDAKLEGTEEKGREAGDNYVKGIIEGIGDGLPDVEKIINRLVDDAIIGATRKGLDINSPSGEGREVGELWDEGIAEGVTDNANTVINANLRLISNLESSSQSAAAAAGTSLGNTMAKAMAQALSAGQALRQAVEAGELTVNGNKVITADAAGIPSLSGQAALDWNAEQKRDFGLPDDWTNQDIVDWLNGGGAHSGGYSSSSGTSSSISTAIKSESSAPNVLVTVSRTGNYGADGKTWGYGTTTKYDPEWRSKQSSVTINQTFNGSTSYYDAKQGAKAGVQEALYS